MAIDFYAGFPHYGHHLLGIYRALPEDLRGSFTLTHIAAQGINAADIPFSLRRPAPRALNPVVVAAHSDSRLFRGRPIILVEHGAGQSYLGSTDGSYAGGDDRDGVVLFICPNSSVADRNRARYPNTPTAIVGCSRLDPFHPPISKPRTDPPTIAITFHPSYAVAPETRSGARYFWPSITLLQDAGYQVLGHGHPRLYKRLQRTYGKLGIEHTPHLDEVFSRADILIADNTSALFEFASLGRPICFLTPPHFRRDIHHGLRFWDAVEHWPEACTPDAVPDAVALALTPPSPERAAAREAFIHQVYAYTDGQASRRAAEAIVELVST